MGLPGKSFWTKGAVIRMELKAYKTGCFGAAAFNAAMGFGCADALPLGQRGKDADCHVYLSGMENIREHGLLQQFGAIAIQAFVLHGGMDGKVPVQILAASQQELAGIAFPGSGGR